MSWSRTATLKLISLYQQHKNLYDVDHKDYFNRQKRDSSLLSMANRLKFFKPDITTRDLVKKIKTLRSQLCREGWGTKNGTENGALRPKLWCFDELRFLQRYLQARDPDEYIPGHTETLDGSGNSKYNNEIEMADELLAEDEIIYCDDNASSNNSAVEFYNTHDSKNLSNEEINEYNSEDSRTTVEYVDNSDDNGPRLNLLETALEIIESSHDESQIYGKVWAAEFKRLNETQQIFAKRAIDEVLYQGRLDNLTSQSSKISTINNDLYLSSYVA